MPLKYKSVTAGYINCHSDHQSLNSGMMLMLASSMSLPVKMYPQRVPTRGFFEEISHLEGQAYNETFLSINEKLVFETQESRSIESLNHYLNILLRRGLYQDVLEITAPMLCDDLPLSTRYIIENARIEKMLVGEEEFNLEMYHALAEEVILTRDENLRLKLHILNRLLVCSLRYKTALPKNACALDYVRHILDLIKHDEREGFQSHIDHSIVYRGISMVTMLGSDKQSDFLEKAYHHAVIATPDCDYETDIKKENICTLLQTLSKWSLLKGKSERAEGYLNEMIEIDPYDSTAYSEYGLFLFNNERFDDALAQFKRATILGPPSVAMNKYFIAQTLKKICQNANIEPILMDVINDDPMALSPLLELIEIYKINKNTEMVQKMVKQVLTKPDLKEQLEEAEFVYYTSLLA